MGRQEDLALFEEKLNSHLQKNSTVAETKAQKAAERKAIRASIKAEKERIVQEHTELVEKYFSLWQELFSRSRSGLTKTRRWHLSLALENFTPADIETVLRVAAADPNTRGQNKLQRPFDDLDNIFRNEERIEMYLRMAQLKGTNLTPSGVVSKGERL